LSQPYYRLLYEIANDLAKDTPGFFEKKGPGKGNFATNDFIAELSSRTISKFGEDFAEKHICGDNSLAVDYHFPSEETVVEIALGLRNPNTEFEKDILKVVMAQDNGHTVSRLVFISKPGGISKCNQPGRRAVIDWLKKSHGVVTEVLELGAA